MNGLDGYCDATVIMVGGKEISRRCLVAAVNRIESEIKTICFRQKQHEHGELLSHCSGSFAV